MNSGQQRYQVTGVQGLTERRLNKHAVIQLLDIRSNAEGWHRIKHAERVTSFQKLVCISLVQRASNQENHVVDHVGISMHAQPLIRMDDAFA